MKRYHVVTWTLLSSVVLTLGCASTNSCGCGRPSLWTRMTSRRVPCGECGCGMPGTLAAGGGGCGCGGVGTSGGLTGYGGYGVAPGALMGNEGPMLDDSGAMVGGSGPFPGSPLMPGGAGPITSSPLAQGPYGPAPLTPTPLSPTPFSPTPLSPIPGQALPPGTPGLAPPPRLEIQPPLAQPVPADQSSRRRLTSR